MQTTGSWGEVQLARSCVPVPACLKPHAPRQQLQQPSLLVLVCMLLQRGAATPAQCFFTPVPALSTDMWHTHTHNWRSACVLQTAEAVRVRCLEAQELVGHLQTFSCHSAGSDFSKLPAIFTNDATLAEAAVSGAADLPLTSPRAQVGCF